ncbi:Uncharacterized protein Fot_37820 [Forsythia ovata]|uniref:Uncharacterized protein n=1 Tax=Forsythia ovata TaxID=205694 RepID=A0ABD1S2B6_9LAMI
MLSSPILHHETNEILPLDFRVVDLSIFNPRLRGLSITIISSSSSNQSQKDAMWLLNFKASIYQDPNNILLTWNAATDLTPPPPPTGMSFLVIPFLPPSCPSTLLEELSSVL